jgi:hypothetical protein
MNYLRRLLLWMALGQGTYKAMVRDMKTSAGARGYVEVKIIKGHRVLSGDWRRTIYNIVVAKGYDL